MVKIFPTLLAGGSGTRLWPLSRKSYPKQFSKLIGDKTLIQGSAFGESVYVPVGAKHRMENNENSPMVLIEVQTGSYLGEDDIVRYEDRYARN